MAGRNTPRHNGGEVWRMATRQQTAATVEGGGRRFPFLSAKWLGAYGVLVVLAAIPVLVFAIGGADAQSFELKGAGGPFVAFSAGLLSFVSPCVLPIVPIYLTNLAGSTVVNGKVIADTRKTMSHATAFVLGLSAVFIAMGASAGLLGFALQDYLTELETGAGLLLIFMGALLIPSFTTKPPMTAAIALVIAFAIFFVIVQVAELQDQRTRMALLGIGTLVAWAKYSGYIRFSFLQRSFTTNIGGNKNVGYTRSAVVGGAFAVGWTPCVGPILGSILVLASQSGDALTGTYLLAFYAAGLGIPFLLAGLALGDATRTVKRLQRYMPAFELASAGMMLALGALLLAGTLTNLNEFFGFAEFNQGL